MLGFTPETGHRAAVGSDHQWIDVRFTASWTSRTLLEPVLVDPVLVADIGADVSQGHGVWRPPLRYERLRLDAAEADVHCWNGTRGCTVPLPTVAPAGRRLRGCRGW